MKISLVGTRTVGKTTTGKLLAKSLGLAFVDYDQYSDECYKNYGGFKEFVKSLNVTELEGWKTYWNNSTKHIKKLYEKDDFVCAIGGTIFGQPYKKNKINADYLFKKSIVIALFTSRNKIKELNILYNRELARGMFKNLDQEELKQIIHRDNQSIKELLKTHSHIKVYVEEKSIDEVVALIKKKIRNKKISK